MTYDLISLVLTIENSLERKNSFVLLLIKLTRGDGDEYDGENEKYRLAFSLSPRIQSMTNVQ